MTKLLLNTGLTPLYTATGSPVPSGAIVLDDEMDDAHEALFAEGVLVYVRPGDVPESSLGADSNMTDEAKKFHAEWAAEKAAAKPAAKPSGRRGGNAAPAVSDDAGVTDSTTEGGSS